MAIVLIAASIVFFFAIAGMVWLALSSLFGFSRGFVNGYYDGSGYREPRRHHRHGHHHHGHHHDHGHHGHGHHGHRHEKKKVDPFGGMFDKKPSSMFGGEKKADHHRHHGKAHFGGGAKKKW